MKKIVLIDSFYSYRGCLKISLSKHYCVCCAGWKQIPLYLGFAAYPENYILKNEKIWRTRILAQMQVSIHWRDTI